MNSLNISPSDDSKGKLFDDHLFLKLTQKSLNMSPSKNNCLISSPSLFNIIFLKLDGL